MRRARQRAAHENSSRTLVSIQSLRAVAYQIDTFHVLAHHYGAHPLVGLASVDCVDKDFLNIRMRAEHRFHLRRFYSVAMNFNKWTFTTDNEHISVSIHSAQIARKNVATPPVGIFFEILFPRTRHAIVVESDFTGGTALARFAVVV